MKNCLAVSVLLLSISLCRAQVNPPHQASKCGPPEYCARTDLRADAGPSTVPALGPAGSAIKDPTFGSHILRVTDGNTFGGLPNISFHTNASAEQNTWNSDSTKFYVLAPGHRTLIFDFEPKKLATRFTGLDLTQHGWGGVEFSHVDPNVIYGWQLGPQIKIQAYNLASIQAVDVFDPASCVQMGSPSYGLDLSVSADDNRFAGTVGPGQDNDKFVFVYDRKLGCRWYNTLTGEMGGAWGPKGKASIPERFLIHNARVSRTGNYVVIAGGVQALMIWQVDSLNVRPCRGDTRDQCRGHWVVGSSHLFNKAWLNLLIRPLNDPSAPIPLLNPPPPPPGLGFESHWSWNNDNSSDTAPVCGSTYANEVSESLVGHPWVGEVLCVRPDAKNPTVWRFAHTFTTARGGFWTTPRGNVSQDGRFFMFTSDWQNTLGMASDGGYRTDVFVVELK